MPVLLDPLVIVRAVHFAACTVAMGTLVLALLAADAARRGGLVDYAALDRRFRGLALAALAAAGVSGALWLILIGRNILGVPLAEVFDDGGLAAVALDTRFGRTGCLRLMLALAAMAALLLWPGRVWPALVATTALMASIAFTGHAGAGVGMAGLFHISLDVIHLVAAAVWLGALPALSWLLLWGRVEPARGVIAAEIARRFGTIALGAVVAIVASGLANTAILVGLPADPLATIYGRALALKIALFAVMLGLAAANRYRLTPALPRSGAMGALAAMALGETALGLGVLLLVGLLGTQPPAAHVHTSSAAINRGAAFVHIHTSQAMAEVVVSPGRTGTTVAAIQLWHEDYRPYAADGVRLTLKSTAPGLLPIERDALPDGNGTWVIDNLGIQSGGEWTVQITIERSGTTFVLEGVIVLAQCSNDC